MIFKFHDCLSTMNFCVFSDVIVLIFMYLSVTVFKLYELRRFCRSDNRHEFELYTLKETYSLLKNIHGTSVGKKSYTTYYFILLCFLYWPYSISGIFPAYSKNDKKEHYFSTFSS